MAWLKVESSVSRNRKFVQAGPAASWLWICGLAYCQEGLTDGFIPSESLDFLGVKHPLPLARDLVTARLWDTVEGGWRIHDYLDHNKPASEVERIKAARRESGEHGGRASGKARLKQTDEAPVEAPVEANKINPSKQTSKQALNPVEALVEPSSSLLCSDRLGSDRLSPAQPIVRQRRVHAAWEGEKGLYVPQVKHRDFIDLRNHSDAERELLAWYERIAAAWVGSPGADMIKFWTARYAETWPATTTPTPTSGPYTNWKPRERA